MELKNCPFCGEKLTAQPDLFTGGTMYYHSNDCIKKLLEHGDFRKLWNTRPIEEALQKRIDELESENARLKFKVQELTNPREYMEQQL